MHSKLVTAACAVISLVLICVTSGYCDEAQRIQLPQPQLDGGKPLMQAIKARKTTREFSGDQVPIQTLSNLLWAAWGINRPESGRRSAPSAFNRQEMDVYVCIRSGAYLYDPKANSLVLLASGDFGPLTGRQEWVKGAPVNLVYVADQAKMGPGEEADKMAIASLDTGFISENVYLFCASEGLATAFRVGIDRKKLAEILKLGPEQKIIAAQSVGLPKGGAAK